MRPCSACEGKGELAWDDEAFYSTHPPESCLCRVCLGSGRLSDVPSNEDAIADAETLRSVIGKRSKSARCLGDAAWFGDRSPESPEWAFYLAQAAARAAFRAVPGLRE